MCPFCTDQKSIIAAHDIELNCFSQIYKVCKYKEVRRLSSDCRKNECKRHEVGHEGRKPFSCTLCAPYQEKSFVRQDLLKRHLRVAHGPQGAATRKRKGNLKDEDEDYWP